MMEQHRLKREIIATSVTNSIVNRMGATFVLRMHEDTSADSGLVAKAYTVAREVFQARQVWVEIERLDNKVPAVVQTEMMLKVWNLLRHATRWLLNKKGLGLDIAEEVENYGEGVVRLQAILQKVINKTASKNATDMETRLRTHGVTRKLARRVANLDALFPVLDIVEVATEQKLKVERVARVYYALGEAMHFGWLRDQVNGLPVDGPWHANARGSLRDELYQHRRALTACMLRGDPAKSSRKLIETWAEERRSAVDHTLHMLDDMRNSTKADYAMVSVAIRSMEQLARLG